MAQEIEIEFKNLLTIDEYNHLLASLPFPKQSQTQVNYYFETAHFGLREKFSALRIREKNDQYQLTLKEPHPDGLLETHDSLTEQEAFSWIEGNIITKVHTNKQLTNLNISSDQLLYYGSLTTNRREIYDGDICIVLDESTYNGQTDYELELEASHYEAGKQYFDTLLNKHKITIKHTPNKIERFFTTLD